MRGHRYLEVQWFELTISLDARVERASAITSVSSGKDEADAAHDSH